MSQMLGHIAIGLLEFLVIYVLVARFTTWLDEITDGSYLTGAAIFGGIGGGLGVMPDLIGGFIGDHNFDSTHYILSTMMGFHYPLDAAYAYFGIADFGTTDNIINLLICVLVWMAIMILFGLTDAATKSKGQEATLKRSVRRGWKQLAATLRGRR